MIKIIFERDKQRAAAYDGEKTVGFCQVQISDREWIITHTELDPAYGGKGIARKLVMNVVERAGNEGAKVTPVCSYAKKVISEIK